MWFKWHADSLPRPLQHAKNNLMYKQHIITATNACFAKIERKHQVAQRTTGFLEEFTTGLQNDLKKRIIIYLFSEKQVIFIILASMQYRPWKNLKS